MVASNVALDRSSAAGGRRVIAQSMTMHDVAISPTPAENLRYEFSPDLVTLSGQRPEETEAIRTARTHLIARHIHDGRRGLAMCAATKGVGCTFTSTNLAVSLAQVGVATLVLDGDLREPSLAQFLKPPSPAQGSKQCLEANAGPYTGYMHPEVIPNLSLLYAGGVSENAQEALASAAFRTLVERCLRDFEFTIIDTPAASQCADGIRISTIIGYTLIVARANTSRFAELGTLAGQLREDGAQIVGTILNET